MSHSLIRLPEVQRRTGYSKAWIYRLMAEQRFPSSIKIGSRAIAFIESEIDEWIREGANKQVISSQADSLIKISRIWADFFPANTSNQPI
ncbi:TPA: AlpA family transcriptional regulator [Klebsiella pneumoniae]|nr:AlpA family transcriptional regulator [Klebsiella pneumoniae]